MEQQPYRKTFDALKVHDGKVYTGMAVGGSHAWAYNGGTWTETKITPDEWQFKFTCTKQRLREAPEGSGALDGTRYHWYILADQIVQKLDANRYSTVMEGAKYKLGHARPNWRGWSYEYQDGCVEDRLIAILEDTVARLKQRKRSKQLDRFLDR
jgi:hypothetical protein